VFEICQFFEGALFQWRMEISTCAGNWSARDWGIFGNALCSLLAVYLWDFAGIVQFFSRWWNALCGWVYQQCQFCLSF